MRQVDVISGPGNLYVTLAKKAVFGQVGIDSLAGPSEVLIIADQTADIKQVASDLLAQAEHDPLAASILLTTDSKLANEIDLEIQNQLRNHPRAEICLKSLMDWGLIVICNERIKDSLDLYLNQIQYESSGIIHHRHNIYPHSNTNLDDHSSTLVLTLHIVLHSENYQ